MASSRLFAAGVAIALLTLAACTSDPSGPPDLDPVDSLGPPASVTITGPRSVSVDSHLTLSAVVRDSAGHILAAPVHWSSSDSTVISIESIVMAVPNRIGTVTLTAASGSAQDTVIITSFLRPYTFLFADTASEADRRIIRDGIQNAHDVQRILFGKAIAESTTISGVFSASGCAQGGAAAFAGGRTITFCLGNQGWKVHGPVIKQKIVQHELFHIWQFAHWGPNVNASSTWVLEGSAEFAGFLGITNLLPFETALGCQIKEATDFANRTPPGPPLPALSSVETRQAFQSTQGPLYTHSMLAANYLVGGGLADLAKLRHYGDSLAAGKSWQIAFEAAFGKSTATFYGQFPGYVSGLAVPATYLCRI